ncbi:MAG: hypothetical protein ACKOXM_01610 [Agromyces sp.]
MPSAKQSHDRGSASLEFITLGIMLLVPMVYLILVLGQLQAAALAADGAARQAVRSWVRSADTASADRNAQRNVELSAGDFGFSPEQLSWTRVCTGPCASAGSLVRIDVAIEVLLPLAPSILEIDQRARITVHGSAEQPVSRFPGRLE